MEEEKRTGYGISALKNTVTGTSSTAIGSNALHNALGCNNVCIGLEAGINLFVQSNVVIIGDYIRDLSKDQEGVLFIGDRVAIGKTINGKPFNLADVINDYLSK